jgi:FAD/FMN-containing dehydrogenase
LRQTPSKIVAVGAFSSFEFPRLNLIERESDQSGSQREFNSPHLFVDMSGMNQIIHVDKISLTVTVEAGIAYWQLATQLQEKGLAVANLSSFPWRW